MIHNNKFIWSSDYSVGVKVIDEQHQHFFDIINEVYDVLEKNGDKLEHLTNVIGELGNYALYHFSTEEEFFGKFNYEGAKQHIEAHDLFREKMRQYIAEVRNHGVDTKRLAADTADFAKEWLSKHILAMDKKYTACFKEHSVQ